MDSKNPITSPPRFWCQLLRWFCHPAFLEDIEGDLEEMYHERLKSVGAKNARWMYIQDTIFLLRFNLIRPLHRFGYLYTRIYNSFMMMEIKNIYLSRTLGILIVPIGYILLYMLLIFLSNLSRTTEVVKPIFDLIIFLVLFTPVLTFSLPKIFIRNRNNLIESMSGMVLFHGMFMFWSYQFILPDFFYFTTLSFVINLFIGAVRLAMHLEKRKKEMVHEESASH